ncbi:XRE family transcriptional regulator [Gallaecimonas kandeliae]|uniref:XRE family transcriptional regulator n=1 Tax=Gallaecimonas kandeliae TaxID=3029055 RepID=UPI00264810F9|nr:XRE family transcriptional regulator [Gallaecimonas kandeliae]WKE67013.1 XRE family transcriptional regulator [Gallaecimonas kandeliae]
MKGTQRIDAALLKSLRRQHCLSQEDLYFACQRRALRLSLATIKRAELGKRVSFRTVREFAAFFSVPPLLLVERAEL